MHLTFNSIGLLQSIKAMIAAIDPKAKQFYIEMGYSESQVLRAYDYAKRNNVDMLDALNMPPPATQSTSAPTKKQQNNYVDQSVLQKLSPYSFLFPFSRIKCSEYEPIYSRSGKQNQLLVKYQLREQNTPVGLLNVSNCCYLNSLLQCYFLMNDFKVALLTAEPLDKLEDILANQSKTKLKRIRNEYELLKKLKNFFTLMALTSKKYVDPSDVLLNLVDSVGEKISYGEEKDLSEINIMIIERLSEGLSFTKKYYNEEEAETTNASVADTPELKRNAYNSIYKPQTGGVKKLFYGTKVEYYNESSEMNQQPPILSDFAGLILNPRFATLYRAMDQEFNFKVQIKGKLVDKHIFIRQQPQYLFMYINRTQYDREQGHMMKNEQKFTFDFVIYLDRYMQKYRTEKEIVNDRIKELIVRRNKVKDQMNHLQILFKKLQDCERDAKELEGWLQKLPREEEFQIEYSNLSGRLNEIEAELKQIESRKEEYHLVYIFVHRGDAVSGHYWGYGRNGESWYRFDINCRKMQQEEIIIDVEKSSGTAYALLYVKPHNIPSFEYQYHLQKYAFENKQHNSLDFRSCFDVRHRDEIIRENALIHQELQIRFGESVKKKTYVDYVNRYSGVKKIVSGWKEQSGKQKMGQIPICNNFSLFLCGKGEYEFSKFSVFQQALLFASNNKITVEKLLHDQNLLGRLQKKFKKSCQGLYHLKHYALLEKELIRYGQLQQEYHLNLFEVIWGVQVLQLYDKVAADWQDLKQKQQITESISVILDYIRIRNNLMKSEKLKKANEVLIEPIYLSQMNNEISRLILLKLSIGGIKFMSLQQFVELSDAVTLQIAAINSGNNICIDSESQQRSEQSVMQEALEVVNNFYEKKNVTQVINSRPKLEKRASSLSSARKLSFESTILGSPTKSNPKIRQSESSDKNQYQIKLITYSPSMSLLLTSKQTWKQQELQNIRINFDYPTRLMNFLKKVASILPIYKKIGQHGKPFTIIELIEEGVQLNQPKYTQSLI